MIRRTLLLTCAALFLANTYEAQSCPPDPPTFLRQMKSQRGVPSLEREWPGGMKMNLRFTIPEDIKGWQMLMVFSKNITKLEIWRAHMKKIEGKVFHLTNMPWNRKLRKGEDLTMAFLARFNGATPSLCFVYLMWKGGNNPSPEPTTTRPPTQVTSNPITTIQPPRTTNPAPGTTQSTTQSPTPATTTQIPPPSTEEPTSATTKQPTPPSTEQTAPPTTEQTTQPSTQQPTPPSTEQPTPPSTTQAPITTTTEAPPTVIPSCSKYDYNEVLHKSILFYEAQRSGKLPANNRIPWRGDSALGDKGSASEDLTGGWYDAGDFVKFNFPMAFSTTLLTWGFIEYKNAYSAAGESDQMLDSIKWPLDYFIKAHVGKNELYGQVGDGHADHAQWVRPEDMTIPRPAFKIDQNRPGSDLAGETSAAMAAGSIAFREKDSQYADTLLGHAKELYKFADQYRGKYTDSIPGASAFYRSSHYQDELAWAAAWLYKATNDQNYLQKAEKHFAEWAQLSNPGWAFSWDEKIAGVQMLMYELTGEDKYKTMIQRSLQQWLPGGSVPYTPKGLAWRIKWGANRYSANTAFLALLAADKGLNSKAYNTFGTDQIHYMLGDTGRSYVVGFGRNSPERPHHRSSSCPDQPAPCTWNDYNYDGPNPQTLYGALVGGPDQSDNYQDKRNDYVMNEVACDYNAGFQSAVAALKAREACEKKWTTRFS